MMIEERKTFASPLECLLMKRKILELTLFQKRQQLMRFLIHHLQQEHEEINIVAVEIPHGYTKEEMFYRKAGFEFVKTFERKGECSSGISDHKNYWKIDLFIKDLRR